MGSASESGNATTVEASAIAGSAPPRCLAIDDLVAMVEGTLPADRADVVISHVDRCTACADVVAKLGGMDDATRCVGRYRIERMLGAGGMGIVYAAFDPELQRHIAIKLVRPDSTSETLQALIQKEARALARVNHPNVVAVYDVGEHDGELYLATELIDGATLAEWQVSRERNEIVDAWIQVARGLAAAHAEGVVHRDVKPANVLVGRDGRVRIGDFGIAHRGGATLALPDEQSTPPIITNTFAGTPAYMAPEQKSGIVDARSDQFSTAIAIVEALTGTRPSADDVIVLEPPALAAALTRALKHDAADRFPTMGELADALALAIAPPRRHVRRAVIAVVAIAALATAVVAYVVTRDRSVAVAETCRVDAVPDAVWSPERKARVAAVTPANVAPRLEHWFATWSTAAADLCTTDRDAPALRERRRACLGEIVADVGRVIDAIETKKLSDPWRIQQSLDSLPRPASCSHAALQKLDEPTASQAAQIMPLRPELTALRIEDQCSKTAALVTQAEAIGYAPFTAETMIEAASCQNVDDVVVAQATLRRAIKLAVEAGDPATEIRLTLALMGSLGAPHADEVIKLADRAHTLVAQLGNDPISDAQVEHQLCQLYKARDQDDVAGPSCERARRGYRIGFASDSVSETLAALSIAVSKSEQMPDVWAMAKRIGLPAPDATMGSGDPDALIAGMAWVLEMARAAGEDSPSLRLAYETNLGKAYQHKAEPERALEHFQRAIAVSGDLAVDAQKVESHHRAAWILIELGRAADAVPVARDAVEVANALDDDAHLAASLDALGLALLETNDAGAGKPLSRAMTVREHMRADGEQRGLTRFLFARSLFATNPARARRLASAAADDIQLYIDSRPNNQTVVGRWYTRKAEAELVTINDWLAKHR